MITNIKIDNFKSLKDVDIDLGSINFVVGPNASGKSNFVEALDFLAHALREDLPFAVTEKGGFFNICHRRQRRARGAIAFEVSSEQRRGDTICKLNLSFQLRTTGENIRADFFIASETIRAVLEPVPDKIGPTLQVDIQREGAGTSSEKYQTVVHNLSRDDVKPTGLQSQFLHGMEFLKDITAKRYKPRRQSLLFAGFLKGFYGMGWMTEDVEGLRVFQLNPRVARQPSAPSVHGELGRRGENLAAAVDQMRLKDPKNFKLLSAWLKDVVPSLSKLLTDYTDTRQLGLFFEEEGFAARWFAEDVSDGTIMSVALFLALLDKRHRVVVFEEPETSLHPWILNRFLTRCRDQSKKRQVIITTHSPLAVAQANPGELYLVERQDGVTTFKRALDVHAELPQIIRKDLIDLGQYWLSGGLGAVPQVPDVDQLDFFGKGENQRPEE